MSKNKIKETKKKKDKKEELEEMVEDIYEGDDDATKIDKPLRTHGGRLLYVLIIVLVGFLSGIVGELLINNYFYYQGYNLTEIWKPQIEDKDKQIIVFKKEEVSQNRSSQVKTLIDNSSQAVVGIYIKRGGESVIDQLYQPRDKTGNAMVLTSDGWLATTITAMPKEEGKELVIINSEKKVFPIEKIVFDKASGVVFLKTAADNLKVVKFADSSTIYPGNSLLVLGESLVSEGGRSALSSIAEVRFRPVTGFADYFSSTEKFNTFLLTKDNLSNDFAGGVVLDMEGGIIGLYSGQFDKPTIIPTAHFLPAFEQLLRQQEIARPYFGVHYIDLSIAVGLNPTISEDLQKGALIFGDKEHKIIAVDSKSPAGKAGLNLGDIVLQVNDDPVDERHSLTELIQQYKIGDVVKLKVQNGGIVREVEVGLVETSD